MVVVRHFDRECAAALSSKLDPYKLQVSTYLLIVTIIANLLIYVNLINSVAVAYHGVLMLVRLISKTKLHGLNRYLGTWQS